MPLSLAHLIPHPFSPQHLSHLKCTLVYIYHLPCKLDLIHLLLHHLCLKECPTHGSTYKCINDPDNIPQLSSFSLALPYQTWSAPSLNSSRALAIPFPWYITLSIMLHTVFMCAHLADLPHKFTCCLGGKY